MKIPKNWSEVTLNQYIQIVDLQKIDMDDIDRSVKILSVLTKEDEDKILDMKLSELKANINKCSFIYDKPVPCKLFARKKIKGNRFRINANMHNINAGEYIDLSTWTKDEKSTITNLHNILAIFFNPVNILGSKRKSCYKNGVQTADSRIKTAELILHNLRMDEVACLSGFFLKNYIGLMKGTLDYVEKNNKEVTKELEKIMKNHLLNFGVGN